MIERLSDISKIQKRLTEVRIGNDIRSVQPKVSIVLPAYNISSCISETLDSIFAQTFTDYEIIIVNDGSKDTKDLEEKLTKHFDAIIYARQENFGASEARNGAISLARGNYIAFLDGDDMWMPEFLESQLKYMEDNNLEMVYCDAKLFGDNYLKGENFMRHSPSNGKVTTKSLIKGECNVITSGTILKKSVLEKFGLFSTTAKRVEDFDLWFRLCKNGVKVGYQKSALIKYRVSNSGLSGSSVQRCERNLVSLRRIRDNYDLNFEELGVWNNQVKILEAELELEIGKFQLTQKKFSEAVKHIAKANTHYQKPKLTFLICLLSVSPNLALYMFKRLRSKEFAFISHDISKN